MTKSHFEGEHAQDGDLHWLQHWLLLYHKTGQCQVLWDLLVAGLVHSISLMFSSDIFYVGFFIPVTCFWLLWPICNFAFFLYRAANAKKRKWLWMCWYFIKILESWRFLYLKQLIFCSAGWHNNNAKFALFCSGCGKWRLWSLGWHKGSREYWLYANNPVTFRHDFCCQGRAWRTSWYSMIS